MLNILTKLKLSALILIIAIFASCDGGAFNDTDEIYLYSPDDNEIVSGNIEFTYDIYESDFVNVAIFTRTPSISSDNKILNWEDCLAGIHTNMAFFSRSFVFLNDMRLYSVEQQDFVGSEAPQLTNDTKYYWLVPICQHS
jgi:hypothetical protein